MQKHIFRLSNLLVHSFESPRLKLSIAAKVLHALEHLVLAVAGLQLYCGFKIVWNKENRFHLLKRCTVHQYYYDVKMYFTFVDVQLQTPVSAEHLVLPSGQYPLQELMSPLLLPVPQNV